MTRADSPDADPVSGGGDEASAAPARLTASALIRIDYFAPPSALSDRITTLYHFRCEEAEIHEMQPASIGHLAIFPMGKGEIRFPDRRRAPSHAVNLLTPFSRAAPFFVKGPFHAIGAVLTPLGWAGLTGRHAGQSADRFVRAGEWLGDEVDRLGKRLCQDYRAGERGGRQCALALAEFIGANSRPVRSRHRQLIATTNRWLGQSLNPDIGDLIAQAAYSQRQLQRLVERYFGLPPRALARKYRALRAAALLSLPRLSDEYQAQIAEAFYDQAHMIREIRHFVGRTPAQLGSEDDSYLNEMLDQKNFRELG